MSLVILIKRIIISLFQLYQKIKKLDDYWSKRIPLTVTVSNVHSNWSVQNAYANIVANTLNIQVNYKRTAAQIASGTSIKNHLCDLTIKGIKGIVPSGLNCLTTSSINNGTGPIVTTHYSNCTRVDDDTWTMQIWVDGNAGGVVAQNGTYSFITIFHTGVVRDMSITTKGNVYIHDDYLPDLDVWAIAGQTWAEWVTSSLNTIGAYIDNSNNITAQSSNGTWSLADYNVGDYVISTDIISIDHEYGWE